MSIELTGLNGILGFSITGAAAGDEAGFTVSRAGDLNGDGIEDFLVASWLADPNGSASGAVYAVFGSTSGFGSTLDLSTLNGSNGFKMSGVSANDFAGYSTAEAGDINGDGIDDVIIGAPGGDEAYVVFGSSSGFSANINLGSLNGSNGFRITTTSGGSSLGSAVASAGDINGDGIGDVIVGAPAANGVGGAYSGQAYVIFGKTSNFTATVKVSDLNGSNGFTLNGAAAYDGAGSSLASAGDVNGDGIDDFIVGAPEHIGIGGAYVVFGTTAGFSSSLNLSSLNGSDGFLLEGVAASDAAGYAVSTAGDVNGDGVDDMIVSAIGADPNAISTAGASYVVFGQTSGFSATLALSSLNGSNGFTVNGAADNDEAGISVASAGDVNGDGVDDIIIGAFFADPNGTNNGGSSYLLFGKTSGFSSTLDLSSLTASDGVIINGGADGDFSGSSVAGIGDINNDGYDDLLIGAPGADPANEGAAYVVYGRSDIANSVIVGTDNAEPLTGTSGDDSILGLGGADSILGLAGNDTIDGGAGDDTMDGGDGNDTIAGYSGRDLIYGGADNDTLHGFGSHDSLYGGTGDDDLRGGYGRDLLNGSGGNDVLRGFEGDDRLFGGGGSDTLFGNDGNDSLTGGGGVDRLKGDAGDDTLNGRFGDDSVSGGAGDDLFEFRLGHDNDIIDDFVAGAATDDVIKLIGFGAAFDTFAEVLAASSQVGADVLIDFGGGDSITLKNVTLANLHADDFSFG
ncbi:MAG: hypothetical protein R3C40_08325 [Parvularculaceae bacterium]